MVTIHTFKNKQGKEIKCLSVPAISKTGKEYQVKIGFSKAKAILLHASDINSVLSGMK